LDFETLVSPFSHSADEVEDGGIDDGDDDVGNNIGDNVSPRGAKRQKSGSPRCEPNLDHISMPPLPHQEDGESSKANACGPGTDESRGDRLLPKRRKLSDALGGRTILDKNNAQSPHSLSPALEEPY
jgi:hypothetical protein